MKQIYGTKKLNSFLLFCYLLVVWLAHALLSGKEAPVFLKSLPLVAVGLALGIPCLLALLGKIKLPPKADFTFRQKAVVFLAAFLASAAIPAVWLAACWPGGFAPDSGYQYTQAVTGVYEDWHPVWHTLIFFWLPLRVTGSVYSISLFNTLVFCAASAHMLTVIRIYGGRGFTILAWCYLMLNPYTGYMSVFPLKDLGFSMACLTASVISLQIWCTGGEAGRSRIRRIALALSLVNASLFRHNGILFSGFLLMALAFTMKKDWWKTALLTALLLAAIRGPLYRRLDVKKPVNRVVETMGLPLAVIGNVVKEGAALPDPETEEFVYAVAPKERWKKEFFRGNFNALKWEGINTDIIEETGRGNILRMMLRCAKSAPAAALRGFIDLTDIVYGLDKPFLDRGMPYFENAPEGLTRIINQDIRLFIRDYAKFLDASGICYIFSIGAGLLLILTAMMARCDLKKREDWARILIALSLFCYDFGTMFLLTGPDDRFFFLTFPVCPVFVLLMFYDRPAEAAPLLPEEVREEEGK